MLNHFQNAEKNDRLLVTSYRETENSAFIGQLFDKYVHLVYGLCLNYLKNRQESQDATMEIFEKITTELLKNDVTHFKSWLYVLSRNHCLTHLKKSQRISEIQLSTEKDYADFVEFEDFFTLIEKEEFDKRSDNNLNRCLEKLNQLQRESIILFYYKEKCYNEIAEALKVNINKVKSHLQNGKRNLKLCLESHEEPAQI